MATAQLVDMTILATDQTWGNRVFASLMQYITTTVQTEAITQSTFPQHVQRKQLAANIINNLANPNPWKNVFIQMVSVNQTVANDATTNGTLVGLTPTQVATAAALCTDTDINNAVASAFNSQSSTI